MRDTLSTEERRPVRKSPIASLLLVVPILLGALALAGSHRSATETGVVSLSAAASPAPAPAPAAAVEISNDDVGCGCAEACLVAR